MRRLLRALHFGIGNLRSAARRQWYGLLYDGLELGKGVKIGRGASIKVVRGGRLTIGDGAVIEAGCDLVAEGVLRIGDRAFIGRGSIIVAVERIEICADVLIAAYATVRDHDHVTNARMPFNRQGLASAPVWIGDNVWLGTKATVLKGVTVASNAVIGAHALVTSDVAAHAVVGGVPARELKTRGTSDTAGRS